MGRIWGGMQAGLRISGRGLWPYPLAVVAGWYLIWLSGAELPQQQWVWIEAVFVPVAVVMGTEPFVGRFERGELEVWLARQPARRLFLYLSLPSIAALIACSVLLGAAISAAGALAAGARACLLVGAAQCLLVWIRSRWFAVTSLAIWWLVGLLYMSEWAGAHPLIAFWHPMRLSGGGPLSAGLEWLGLAAGVLLLVAAWRGVGSDHRWML